MDLVVQAKFDELLLFRMLERKNMINRRSTAQVKVGALTLGSGNPIYIQSMANTPASDIEAGVNQALELQAAGCDIFRFAVPTVKDARIFAAVKEAGVTMPLVADIHFDYKIALEAAAAGADKIRINPGNIGDDEKVKAVVNACREKGLPIRIGVNSGSLEKHILAKYGSPTPEALAESAMYHVSLLEKFDFNDIVISIKASSPQSMIEANRILAQKCNYPLHIGVTEAGSQGMGTLKSAVGIGSLLCDGIGDTVRVSLTANPSNEIEAARNILKAVGYTTGGVSVVSCPTCGRTQIDLIALVDEFEARENEIKVSRPITVAIMGCIVNGPGEAREADIGIAGGKGEAMLIRKGEIIGRLPEDKVIDSLISKINELFA